MKTLLLTLLVLILAVGLSAVTDLINFNDTSNLTDLFNHGTNNAFTNTSDGGLSNTGSVNIPLPSYDIWTHKTGFPVPEEGNTATLSAYFKISVNAGYSGMGFAEANVNQQQNAVVYSSPVLGMTFHGGGGSLYNSAMSYNLNWVGVSGDLVVGNWYKMIFSILNTGSNVFDLELEIWNSDASGVLGTLFTSQSQAGLTNIGIGEASTLFPFFTNSSSRSGRMDDLYVEITEPIPPSVFSGGDGTGGNPYVITTPNQLNEVRNYLDSNFILGNDIDLDVSPYNTGEGWVPIGGKLANYTVLDLSLATGGSFTITGMGMEGEPVTTYPISLPTDADMIEMIVMEANINTTVTEINANLFAISDYISLNLGLVEGTVDSHDVVSIPFSGIFNGNGKTISNLYINQPVVFSTGLFGATEGSVITGLTLTGVNVYGGKETGSIIGFGKNTIINSCSANGNVSAESWSGGMAGYLTCDDAMSINNCSTSGTVSGINVLGGLFGHVQNYSLTECYSTSNVESFSGDSGGLVGSCIYSNVANCFARGSVSAEDGYDLGGLIGWSHTSDYANCYSTGAISSSSPYNGGMFGSFAYSSDYGCYWDTVTSGMTVASGNTAAASATGCNTDEMTYPYSAFSGWDFTNPWIADVSPLNGGYPMLRIETPDYPNAIDVPVGIDVVTVTGGGAYNGSGFIPETTGLAFLPNQTFTFIGTGTLTISIATEAQYGAYWQTGAWHTVSSNAGVVTFVIDFDAVGKGEVPVVLGNEDETLPLEMSSFSATVTQQNYVQLNWVTQSEKGVIGYYIYRNNANNIESAQIVSNLITACNTSQQQAYVYTDQEVEPGSWYYWIQNMDMNGQHGFHGSISVVIQEPGEVDAPVIPLITSMQSIYPNPFNPSTTIAFGLDKAEHVNIQIYNVKGQLVRNLISETKPANSYRIVWNGANDSGKTLPSGIYYARMTAGKYTTTRKLVIMK